LSDDPEPTEYRHYEIYLYGAGASARGGWSGAGGLDFNYGAAPDLQLTAVFPIAYDRPNGERLTSGLGNVELAAKFRFLHQQDVGWDVAVFPRVFLPSGSHLGDDHAALLLPIWIGRDWDKWATFGGGGCELNRGGDSQDFCLAGWSLTRQLSPNFRLGAELFHQMADAKGGDASTIAGIGATYDVNEHAHILGYVNNGLQNRDTTERLSWYGALLVTF
jgi:hypothetical protein